MVELATPTVPPEWLTRPPTPGITRQAKNQLEAEAVEPPPTSSPVPEAPEQKETAELEVEPTLTPIIKLPRLFGRLWTISAEPGVPQEFISTARAMAAEQPDAILHFTDPRFWGWLYILENQIRRKIPLTFLNIWDNPPAPMYNRGFYESCDAIFSISKQTMNINRMVLGDENCFTMEDVKGDN